MIKPLHPKYRERLEAEASAMRRDRPVFKMKVEQSDEGENVTQPAVVEQPDKKI